MEKNMGMIDRMVRLALAFALFSTYFLLEGQERYFSVIGLYPFITASLSYCPFYKLIGVKSTSEHRY